MQISIGVKSFATLLANYEEDSLDGDSFVSQSRFEAYAMQIGILQCFRRFSSLATYNATGLLLVSMLPVVQTCTFCAACTLYESLYSKLT